MAVRVLWLIKGLGPGGSERLLAAAAQAHTAGGTELTCAYLLGHKDHLVAELESHGVRCLCLAPRRRLGGLSRWPLRLRTLLRSGEFDIVHIHAPLPGIAARLIVRTLPNGSLPKVVTTEHNTMRSYRFPIRIANRVTARFDDATITVSDEALRSLRGAARRRATSLQHGIDVRSVTAEAAQRDDRRAEFGIGPDEVLVGTVANFRIQKDYPNLLAAVAELRSRGVSLRLVAVGQGPLEAAIRAQVVEHDLHDIVTLTGYRADATAVMAAFDVFVLASRWEGLPVALMEALALGLPLVATAVGGVAETVRDGVDGILVEPENPTALADALQRVIGDTQLRARLGAAALRRADEFDMARAIAVIEALYDDLTPGRADAGSTPPPRPLPPRRSGLQIRPATPQDRTAVIEMMRGPLQWGNDARNAAFYTWKHDRNPFGPSPTWVAVDGTRVVAVRAFMRWRFHRGNRIIDAVRAVDTATDPEYQGRGLFRELTLIGVDALRADGVGFVFNTPNEQSLPGYLSMGWHEVGHLPTTVLPRAGGLMRTARSRAPADRWSADLTVGVGIDEWLDLGGLARHAQSARPPDDMRALRTAVSHDFLRWRYGSLLLPYRVVDDGEGAVIVRARQRGRSRELVVATSFGADPAHADHLVRRTLRAAECDHALRLGAPNPRGGALPMPGAGPLLTWRALGDAGMPPLGSWNLALGDIELF